MLAAVVTAFGEPPRCQEFPAPQAPNGDEAVLDVVAVGLHPRVRSQAAGSHYSSTDELPLIPGVDGVGRTTNGQLRYFVLRDTTMGSMAEQALVDLRASIALPDTVDPVQIAAVMNPAMSSWVALRRRSTSHQVNESWCMAPPATQVNSRCRSPSTSAPAMSPRWDATRSGWRR